MAVAMWSAAKIEQSTANWLPERQGKTAAAQPKTAAWPTHDPTKLWRETSGGDGLIGGAFFRRLAPGRQHELAL